MGVVGYYFILLLRPDSRPHRESKPLTQIVEEVRVEVVDTRKDIADLIRAAEVYANQGEIDDLIYAQRQVSDAVFNAKELGIVSSREGEGYKREQQNLYKTGFEQALGKETEEARKYARQKNVLEMNKHLDLMRDYADKLNKDISALCTQIEASAKRR